MPLGNRTVLPAFTPPPILPKALAGRGMSPSVGGKFPANPNAAKSGSAQMNPQLLGMLLKQLMGSNGNAMSPDGFSTEGGYSAAGNQGSSSFFGGADETSGFGNMFGGTNGGGGFAPEGFSWGGGGGYAGDMGSGFF